MGAAEEAEDVVQETFLRALKAPPRRRGRAWLYRVALNVLHDRGRRRRTAEAGLARLAAPAELPAEAGPAARAEERDLAEAAWRRVEGLPAGQRAALILRVQRHMDYAEIGVALECSPATARQHFYLGVRAVRDALAEVDGE